MLRIGYKLGRGVFVIPANAGIQVHSTLRRLQRLDSGFRRNDVGDLYPPYSRFAN